MAIRDYRPGRARLLFAACWPALVLIAACESSGGNAYDRDDGGHDGSDPGEDPMLNILGTWSVTFTPDRCESTNHTGAATILALASDTTQVAPQSSRIELNTFGCQDIGGGLLGFTEFRFEQSFPATLTQIQFQLVLNEFLSEEGDYTVTQFDPGTVSFRRTTPALPCDSGDNIDCGLFEWTR